MSGKSCGWFVKFNGAFKRLGDVQRSIKVEDRKPGLLYTVADVTELADRVRDMMKAGQDPDPYIVARARGALHEKAAATSDSVAAKEDAAWTWTVLAERYPSEHVSVAKNRSGKIKPPKPKSIKDVRDTLLHPDVFDRIGHRPARDVDKIDIEALCDKWWREDRKRAQQKLCVYQVIVSRIDDETATDGWDVVAWLPGAGSPLNREVIRASRSRP